MLSYFCFGFCWCAYENVLSEGSELEAIKAKGSGTSAEMLKQAKCYSNIEVSSNQVEMSK